MEEIVYLNRKLLPVSQARLSPFDHGFLYGYGLFETMRAYSGKVFRLAEHLDRLGRSADFLGMKEKLAAYGLADAVNEVIAANHLSDARIRLTVSAGPGEMVPDPDRCGEPTVFVVARPYTPLATEVYEQGFCAHICPFRREASSPLPGLKSCSYLLNILARREAKRVGADEGLILNGREELAEGSVSNLFIVSGNELLTPPLESGILAGITRETILKIAASLKIKRAERRLLPDDLLRADEAFLTNSLFEVMPLTRVDDAPVGSGRPGPITLVLMSAYKDLVKAELKLA